MKESKKDYSVCFYGEDGEEIGKMTEDFDTVESAQDFAGKKVEELESGKDDSILEICIIEYIGGQFSKFMYQYKKDSDGYFDSMLVNSDILPN